MKDTMNPPIAIAQESKASLRIAAQLPVLAVLAIGVVVVYCVGFSPMTQAHNAAHDTRHANGFPCH